MRVRKRAYGVAVLKKLRLSQVGSTRRKYIMGVIITEERSSLMTVRICQMYITFRHLEVLKESVGLLEKYLHVKFM